MCIPKCCLGVRRYWTRKWKVLPCGSTGSTCSHTRSPHSTVYTARFPHRLRRMGSVCQHCQPQTPNLHSLRCCASSKLRGSQRPGHSYGECGEHVDAGQKKAAEAVRNLQSSLSFISARVCLPKPLLRTRTVRRVYVYADGQLQPVGTFTTVFRTYNCISVMLIN